MLTILWNVFLEIFASGLFVMSQFYGGHLAAAIFSFSLVARLLLLPFTVRLTLRAREHAQRIAVLKPSMNLITAKWKKDPARQQKELLALYRKHEIAPVDSGVIKGALAQAPIHLGLFSAVRSALASRTAEQGFLWVSNLARPDVGIALLACLLMGLSGATGATQTRPGLAIALPAVSGLVMALFMSAGLGLYLAATGMVGTLQGLIVRRIEVGRNGGTSVTP